jgi:hypothetical protein
MEASVAHSRTGLGGLTVQVEFTEKRVSRNARKERQGNGKVLTTESRRTRR